jgi:hypothetical protein
MEDVKRPVRAKKKQSYVDLDNGEDVSYDEADNNSSDPAGDTPFSDAHAGAADNDDDVHDGRAGPRWTVEEDKALRKGVEIHGLKDWKKVADFLASKRTESQCMHRWQKVGPLTTY